MTELTPSTIVATYFPGPQSENEVGVRAEVEAVLDSWFNWRKGLFATDPTTAPLPDQNATISFRSSLNT